MNQHLIDFISEESAPVAALVVTKSDAEAHLDRSLSSDEWANLIRDLEKWGSELAWENLMDALGHFAQR